MPRRRSRRVLLVALLLTLGLQLLMRGLLGAPPEPVDVAGPAARSRLLWLPLCQRLAAPLYSVCYPRDALSRVQGWVGSLSHSLPSKWHVNWPVPCWPASWHSISISTAEPVPSCSPTEGPLPPSWLQQQAAASTKVGQLQQELAVCSTDAHRARQQHAAAADEVQRCQRQLKTVTADAIKCQGELLAALDGQAEEAAASEAAVDQAQAAQAASREVQKQVAMVESRAALLAQQLQEAGHARQRAEEAGRSAGG